MHAGDVIAVPRAAAVRKATSASVRRGRGAQKTYVMMAAGLAAVLLLAIGLAVVVMTSRPTQTTSARVDENAPVSGAKAVEAAPRSGAKAKVDPVVVPPPQGTMRRMDAISKSFSKQ
jgi:hypothetical protein